MIVFTGIWKNAGTDGKVNLFCLILLIIKCKLKIHFILTGDNDETSVQSIENSKKRFFQRGSIDSFIFSVPK